MTLEPLLQDDKKKLLNVSELTEVEKNYSYSALKILQERYLLKDDKGNTVERLDELLKRVAVGVGIMEVLYDEQFYDKEGKQDDIIQIYIWEHALEIIQLTTSQLDYKGYLNHHLCSDWGDGFIINPFHRERLLARYVELAKECKMKVDYREISIELSPKGILKKKYLPLIQKYYDLMAKGIFLPNTPALMNCGTKLGMNAACFTLEIKDDLVDIFETYTDVAKIFKAGGGTGVNYSSLRPEGAYVRGTGGKSSGTLSWLKLMDGVTGSVSQGGKRRGASMGILNMYHQEIEKFIDLKDNKTLENHNISICTPDSFFQKYLAGEPYSKYIMNKVSKNAWKTGDPGMVFLDAMNSNNLLQPVFDGKPIDVTNPCSEISMYPYESCILASINLSKFVNDGEFDYKEFESVVRIVTQFLDSMIDATKYPIEEINEMTKKCRRIGVGFMGLADALVRMKIPYNSKEGFEFAEEVSKRMTRHAMFKSMSLAHEKGPFPFYNHKNYPQGVLPTPEVIRVAGRGDKTYRTVFTQSGFRNCSVTTVAPTGTLAMLADCSSGIEPLFSLKYIKKVTLGEFEYPDKNYEKALKEGSMTEQEINKVFVTAMDIHPYDHLMMQAVAQKWISNGISKTINLTSDSTQKMIENAYVLSWALGNKGISVYRDGCKDIQVLNNSGGNVSCKNQKISDYTKSVIKGLSNLTEEYKEQLLMKEEESIVEGAIEQKSKPQNCPECGVMNMLIKSGRGDQCFMCFACGSQMGSCG
jgi:ribonucleoside-diphosphate reductase alpha chain